MSPDRILEILQDGRPHSLPGIAEETRSSPTEVQRIVDFLLKYGFIMKAGRYVRIEEAFRTLLQGL